MRLVHFLAHSLVVASFKGIAYVKDALNLTYYLFCPLVILVVYVGFGFIEPFSLGIP